MQLPSVDRQPGLRPAGADLVSATGVKVIPVPPVNPAITVNPAVTVNPANQASTVTSPSVVNKIGEGARTENSVYTSVPDPLRRGTESATNPKDWTIKRPEPEKVEDPPPVPISKLLLDFLQAIWRASASAIEPAQNPNQNLLLNQHNPNATAGELAKEDLTYAPSKIKKNEAL